MPSGAGPGALELGTVAAKAIEPTEGQASQAAEISIVFATGFDREPLTARTVMAAMMIRPVPRMIPARRFRLVGWLFFIAPCHLRYLDMLKAL